MGGAHRVVEKVSFGQRLDWRKGVEREASRLREVSAVQTLRRERSARAQRGPRGSAR